MRWFVVVWIGALLALHVSAQTRPFAEGSIDLDTPYVGQPLIYTLRIYAQDAINSSTITEPPFTGFGRSQILLDASASVETIEGVTYNIIEQNYIIYPLRTGQLQIEPFIIDLAETPFRSATRIYSNAVDISVSAYPQPAPDSFINAIGQFDIQAQAEPNTLNAGDALTLSITISGTGNFEQLLAPELPLPDGWRAFDIRSQYQQDTLRFGSKTFTWSVIVEGEGMVPLPAIPFSYFNPQSEQYETRMSAPISITVNPSETLPEARPINPVSSTTQNRTPNNSPPPLMEITSSDIRVILPSWFWWLWGIAPILSAGWIVTQRREQATSQTRLRRRKKPKSKLLHEIKRDLSALQTQDPQQAYQGLVQVILSYLESKSGQAVDTEQIEFVLAQLPTKQGDALRACIDEALAGQYAPVTKTDVKRLSRRVFQICQRMEAEHE